VLVWLDLGVSELESMLRDELIVLARGQADRLDAQAKVVARQDAQITAMAGQIDELMSRLEATTDKLARLEHLLSRNSSNSNWPSSKDGGPGGTPPSSKERRAKPGGRANGKQPGAPGSALAWSEDPGRREERFPTGPCACGKDLDHAEDLGVVDRYQQWEIPLVTVSITQYDQHAVACACGAMHTAKRPQGAGAGRTGYGPQLRAFAVYLMVVHFVPVARCREILTALTGAQPSLGFVHGLLTRAAALLTTADQVIRTLITLAVAVCADETPLKVGPATPAGGKTQAKGYLLVACTELYTHFLLGDRSMDTFREFVFTELHKDAVIVHDRYQNYDSVQLGSLTHQLCLAHALRDLASAAELYPDEVWPAQLADEVRELIHRANQAPARGEQVLPERIRSAGLSGLRAAVTLGLAHTGRLDDAHPGARKTRLLLDAFRKREDDFLRFTRTFGFHPLAAWCANTQESLAMLLREGRAGSNTAADHLTVLTAALAQVPDSSHAKILVRVDGAGATHELLEHLERLNTARRTVRYLVGWTVTADDEAAVGKLPERAWEAALRQDGDIQDGYGIAELTGVNTRTGWPQGMRLLVRRVKPSGRQVKKLTAFELRTGWKYSVIATNIRHMWGIAGSHQPQFLDVLARSHATVEDRVRTDKSMGLRNLPSKSWQVNAGWMLTANIGHDLDCWVRLLALHDRDDLVRAEPATMRHRLYGVPARLVRHARRRWLRFDRTWPCADALVTAWRRLTALPAPT
jgi:hypothetical protein